jgi:O-antigen/teichoic acid export membrane protein
MDTTKQTSPPKGLIARNSMLNLLGQVLPLFVGVATIPYIVRGLGTNGYGILSIAWMLLGYFGMFDLGLSRATTKFVAQHLDPAGVHRLPGLIWTALALQLLMGLVGALLCAAFVPVSINHFFKMPADWAGEAKTSLFILCASLPILLVNNALRGVLEAAQRFDLSNYVKVPASISFYLMAALAIPFGVRVSGIVLLLVLCRFAATVAYFLLCLRVFPDLKKGFSISREAIRPLAAYGGWVTVSNTAGPIFAYIERFIIATVLSVGALTFYSAPFELISKIMIFPASVTAALFPVFSYHGNKNGTIVSDMTSRTVKYLLFVMTPIVAVFVFFARQILQLWLGAEFASRSTVVLQLLAISFFLSAFAYIPYTSVQAVGRPDLKAVLDLVALPTYALYAWWLTRHLGINGAALAKLLSAAIDSAFLFLFAWKLKVFSVRAYISGPLLRALLASVGMIVAVYTIGLFHPTLSLAVLYLVACFACYTAAFWVMAVDSDDRLTIRTLSKQMLARRG